MIKKFTIYGEKYSGIDYFKQAICENIGLTYKNNNSYDYNDDTTLFICIVRNPLIWLTQYFINRHEDVINKQEDSINKQEDSINKQEDPINKQEDPIDYKQLNDYDFLKNNYYEYFKDDYILYNHIINMDISERIKS